MLCIIVLFYLYYIARLLCVFVCACVCTLICVFFTELTSKMDLQALSGKTLSVTSGSSSPGPTPTTETVLCPYVNLLLCNAQPAGERHTLTHCTHIHG